MKCFRWNVYILRFIKKKKKIGIIFIFYMYNPFKKKKVIFWKSFQKKTGGWVFFPPLKYLSIKELSNELGSVRFDFICTAHFYFIWTLSRNRFTEICITGDAQKDPLQFTWCLTHEQILLLNRFFLINWLNWFITSLNWNLCGIV